MKIKGLLLKDIFELWAQSRTLLLLTAVYLLIPVFTDGVKILGSVAVLLLAMLPVSALGYDERCKWERYALAMPLSRRELFLGKLLLGVLAVLLGTALQAAAALLAGRGDILAALPLTAASGIVYLLLVLPLMFRLGVEKGRYLLLLLTAGFLVLTGVLMP